MGLGCAEDPFLKAARGLAEMPFDPLTKHFTYRQGEVELAERRRAALWVGLRSCCRVCTIDLDDPVIWEIPDRREVAIATFLVRV